jgi:tagatose-1,6-bisphosphate aldolase
MKYRAVQEDADTESRNRNEDLIEVMRDIEEKKIKKCGGNGTKILQGLSGHKKNKNLFFKIKNLINWQIFISF